MSYLETRNYFRLPKTALLIGYDEENHWCYVFSEGCPIFIEEALALSSLWNKTGGPKEGKFSVSPAGFYAYWHKDQYDENFSAKAIPRGPRWHVYEYSKDGTSLTRREVLPDIWETDNPFWSILLKSMSENRIEKILGTFRSKEDALKHLGRLLSFEKSVIGMDFVLRPFENWHTTIEGFPTASFRNPAFSVSDADKMAAQAEAEFAHVISEQLKPFADLVF